MASILDELFSVLDGLPSGYTNVASGYKARLSKQKTELDIYKSGNGELNAEKRIDKASQVFSILFADSAILSDHSSKSMVSEMQQRSWSKNCWLPAKCFVMLENAVEVALALRVVSFFDARFAIRGTGHNTNPGFSSIDGGILLDIRALQAIDIASDKTMVSVGPGSTWSTVYEELEAYGLTAVGGRAGVVGVGGYILGGGMSHFSNHWGLGCDHVEMFEVVLPDSSIVEASATQHSDLYWALKGGGPNFGIVTRLDLATNPEYKLWYTIKVYSPTDAERVIKASAEVTRKMLDDDRLGFVLVVTGPALTTIQLYRNGTEMPDAFCVFDDIHPMAVVIDNKVGSQATAARDMALPGLLRREIGTAALGIDADLLMEIHQLSQELTKEDGVNIMLGLQPIGPPAIKTIQSRGGNPLKIPSVPQVWVGGVVDWKDESQDEIGRKRIRDVISGIELKARNRGLLLDFKFPNDAGLWQDPLSSFGSESVAKLQAIARKYDPKGVMQLQGDGFLLRDL